MDDQKLQAKIASLETRFKYLQSRRDEFLAKRKNEAEEEARGMFGADIADAWTQLCAAKDDLLNLQVEETTRNSLASLPFPLGTILHKAKNGRPTRRLGKIEVFKRGDGAARVPGVKVPQWGNVCVREINLDMTASSIVHKWTGPVIRSQHGKPVEEWWTPEQVQEYERNYQKLLDENARLHQELVNLYGSIQALKKQGLNLEAILAELSSKHGLEGVAAHVAIRDADVFFGNPSA